jgi:hypothetical protein
MSYLPAGGVTALRPSPSAASHNSHISQSSSVSRISGSSSPQQGFTHSPRPDSPSLGSNPRGRAVSGMTEPSGRDSTHIRQLSLDSEVSDASGPQGPGISQPEPLAGSSTGHQHIPVIATPQDEEPSNPLDRFVSPVSPTTPGAKEGSDHITGRPSAGSGSGLAAALEGNREGAKVKRRSNFGEMLDDE